MKILIAGCAGMLGSDVRRAGKRAGHQLQELAHGDLDVTNAQAVERAMQEAKVEALVNCTAWTYVDGAECDRDGAFAVNAAGAGNLAQAAASAGIPLVHVSTDYVFDGGAPHDDRGNRRPYVESDPTGPISVYGQSKLAGEELVLEASPSHTVVRSAWLFGVNGRNFADTMLKRADEGKTAVQVVEDQVGCPTWTGHLAPALLGLLERKVSGIVHLAGAGAVSWHDFAVEIFRQAGRSCRVEATTSEQQKKKAEAEGRTVAQRPAWSVMASEREDVNVLALPDWHEGLAGYLEARTGMMGP